MEDGGLSPAQLSDGELGADRSAPLVTVIVPHFRDFQNLDRCLRALERQTYPRADFEIIVADNASPEGEAAVAEVVAGRARLVVVQKRGAGAARNGGVAVARGQILAFTDSDCRPEAEWLAEGLRALETCDFVGGRMTVLVGDPQNVSPEEAFEQVYAFQNEAYVERQGFTVSANLFCSKELFLKAGGFLAAGIAEDQEWCWRARDMGYRISYAPASIVGHPARKNWNELLKKWRRVNGDNFGLMTRAPGGRMRWLLRSFVLPASAIIHTPKALFSPKLKGVRQRVGAIAVLHRLRWWRLADSLRLLVPKANS